MQEPAVEDEVEDTGDVPFIEEEFDMSLPSKKKKKKKVKISVEDVDKMDMEGWPINHYH